MINYSVIGLMLTYSITITQTLNWNVRQSCEIETNIVSVERIKQYIELQPEAAYEPQEGFDKSWPSQGRIDFEAYSTRYRPELDFVVRVSVF